MTNLKKIGTLVHQGVMDGRKNFPRTKEGRTAKMMVSELVPVFKSKIIKGTLYPRFALSRSGSLMMETHPHNLSNRGLTSIQVLLRAHKVIDPHTHRNGLNYFAVPNGVLIIPDDCTYTRFISNTWYHDEDIAGL
jgi:hypothetical protein